MLLRNIFNRDTKRGKVSSKPYGTTFSRVSQEKMKENREQRVISSTEEDIGLQSIAKTAHKSIFLLFLIKYNMGIVGISMPKGFICRC